MFRNTSFLFIKIYNKGYTSCKPHLRFKSNLETFEGAFCQSFNYSLSIVEKVNTAVRDCNKIQQNRLTATNETQFYLQTKQWDSRQYYSCTDKQIKVYAVIDQRYTMQINYKWNTNKLQTPYGTPSPLDLNKIYDMGFWLK